jgi:2-phospho-L-lactate guanylyltransferase
MSPAARALLCRKLFLSTVSLARAFATRIAVVSGDPQVIGLAAQLEALPILDRGAGLNAALFEANAHLLRERGRDPLLVMPIDLPLLDRATLEQFLANPAEVLIAPDAKDLGTNLLRIGSVARQGFDFRYGPGSFDRHIDAATSQSLGLRVFRSERTAFDLDEPGDAELAAKSSGLPSALRDILGARQDAVEQATC